MLETGRDEFEARLDDGRRVRIARTGSLAWAAEALERAGEGPVGVARCVRDGDERSTATIVLEIGDDLRGRGLDRLLLETAVLSALEAGIDSLVGYLEVDDLAGQESFVRMGAPFGRVANGVVVMELPLPPAGRTLRSSRQLASPALR